MRTFIAAAAMLIATGTAFADTASEGSSDTMIKHAVESASCHEGQTTVVVVNGWSIDPQASFCLPALERLITPITHTEFYLSVRTEDTELQDTVEATESPCEGDQLPVFVVYVDQDDAWSLFEAGTRCIELPETLFMKSDEGLVLFPSMTSLRD